MSDLVLKFCTCFVITSWYYWQLKFFLDVYPFHIKVNTNNTLLDKTEDKYQKIIIYFSALIKAHIGDVIIIFLFTKMWSWPFKSYLEHYPLSQHLSNIDCLMVHTAYLVCFISTVNGHIKKWSLGRPALVAGT